MKKRVTCVLALALALFMKTSFAQNVAINTDGSLPDNNAILDIKSSTKGILIPRLSSTARASIPATKGLLVYDTTTSSFWYHTGTAWQNLAAISNAWSLNGNSGTDSTNFVGTMENKPFLIKVNNQLSGGMHPRTANVSWGFMTGPLNTTGVNNTSIGSFSFRSNTTGDANTAVGANALNANTTGIGNTALGFVSLLSNTTGQNNVANGPYSLYAHTTGNLNTASGASALRSDISGELNTAFGALAMTSNITGSKNTVIGSDADVSASNLNNATALGYGAIVNASNKIRIGNSAVTVIEGQVPFTTPSDGRFKFNVQEDVKGLSFINQLRPVTYQFDVKRFDAQYATTSSDNDVQWVGYNEVVMMRRSGFIAQEVEKAATTSGYNFSGIIKPTTEQDHYGLSYESFVVPLVKAVQELSKQVIDLQNQVNALKQSQPNLK